MFIIKSIELNNRNNSLNLLRLIFASFVLIGHSFGFISVENNLPSAIKYLINLAVPCFFVVSGYLITASACKNDLKTFFKKRFARIYPAYFICLIVIILLFAPITYILENGGSLRNYFIENPSPLKFLISNLPLFMICPQIGTTLLPINGSSWNGSVWTLIFELGCYISIALIMKVVKKRKTVFGLYLILIIISFFYPRGDGIPDRSLLNLFIYAVNLFSIFLGGSIVYLIKDRLVFNWKYLVLSAVFCVLVMNWIQYGWACELCAVPMTYIIIYISAAIKSPKALMENDISYGVYIYAWPIQTLFAIALKTNIISYTAICFIVTFAFAVLSWIFVEKPILMKVK